MWREMVRAEKPYQTAQTVRMESSKTELVRNLQTAVGDKKCKKEDENEEVTYNEKNENKTEIWFYELSSRSVSNDK